MGYGWKIEVTEYIKTCIYNQGDNVVLFKNGPYTTGFNLFPSIDKSFLLPEQEYHCSEITTTSKNTITRKFAIPLVKFERIK